ncbi:MAG: glycosyl transferase family 90 [Pseudomonadota bacterium]
MRSIIIFLISILPLYAHSSAAHNLDLKQINADAFIKQNDSPERRAIVSFIVDQFKPLASKEVMQGDIDYIWNNLKIRGDLCIGRFQIINQKLYANGCKKNDLYFFPLLSHFHKLTQKYLINDVDFIVFMRDEVPTGEDIKSHMITLPAFMMSKDLNNPYEKHHLLLPDAYMVDDNWSKLMPQIENANTDNPWHTKINKIFWRGSSTGNGGMIYNMENYDKLPRIALAMLSRLYPDLIDAKTSQRGQFVFSISSLKLYLIFNHLFGGVSWVNEADHIKYKYLISIDGNTCAWKRVPWIMLSNSVLLKQETQKIEWFYPALKPYVHYVPVNERLTDIFPKLAWMQDHDSEIQKISQNAQKFVRNNLMPEDIEAHTVIILNEYHKLHKGGILKPTLPPIESYIDIIKNQSLAPHEKREEWLKSSERKR